jgi:hypothetical protein
VLIAEEKHGCACLIGIDGPQMAHRPLSRLCHDVATSKEAGSQLASRAGASVGTSEKAHGELRVAQT